MLRRILYVQYIFLFFPQYLHMLHKFGWQIKSRHFISYKAIKIINFANIRDPVTPLYKAMKITKLSDNIRINNVLFLFDDVSGPPALQNAFQLSASSYSYVTRSSTHKMVKLPVVRSKSIKFQACHEWNSFNKHFKNKVLHSKSKFVCKKTIKNIFRDIY